MEIKEFRGFAIKKIDSYRTEDLEILGHVNRGVQIYANFGVKNIRHENEFIHCFYECKFDFLDTITNKNIGYVYLDTESFIRFENNKKVIDLWVKNKEEFNKNYNQDLGHYHFMESIPIVSIILQKMQLPVPIPSPFIQPEKISNKE